MGERNGDKYTYPLGWKEIYDILPHRYPFLMVDKIVDGKAGEWVHCQKLVSFNEHMFAGHFPYMPVFPGVLQLEALAQAAAVLAHISADFDTADTVPFLMSMDKVKFRSPVQPGDVLDLRAEIVVFKRSLQKAHCIATVNGKKTCEATIAAAIRPKAEALEAQVSQVASPQLGYRIWEMPGQAAAAAGPADKDG